LKYPDYTNNPSPGCGGQLLVLTPDFVNDSLTRFQRFKDILRRQLEVYIRAFFIWAKVNDGCFFLRANAGIVDGSRHIVARKRSNSETYHIAARLDILGFEIAFSVDVGGGSASLGTNSVRGQRYV
jgi:hypothetical protein